MCYNLIMSRKSNKKLGITFTEIMLAALIMAIVTLPSFAFLSSSVKDTERIYVETIAMNHARQIMDVMLNNIPWENMIYKPGKPYCVFDKFRKDKLEDKYTYKEYIEKIFPKIFGKPETTVFEASGIDTTDKGFVIRSRAMVYNYGENNPPTGNQLSIRVDETSNPRLIKARDVMEPDQEGNYNYVKKIVVEVKYTLKKGVDPIDLKAPSGKSIILVAYKSRLDDSLYGK